MPLSMVDAINLGPNRVKIAWFVYSICLKGNHALFHKELWDWLLTMAGEDDPLGNLIKSAIEEANNRYKSVLNLRKLKRKRFVTLQKVTLIT